MLKYIVNAKIIDKNVDHMNLRKISLYDSVKERFVQ
jgi:hypothetical protein